MRTTTLTIAALGALLVMSNANAQEPAGEPSRIGTRLEIVKITPPAKLSVTQVKKNRVAARFKVGEGVDAPEFDIAIAKDTAPSLTVEVLAVGDGFDYVYAAENGTGAEGGDAIRAIDWIRPTESVGDVDKSQPEGVKGGFGMQWSFPNGLKPGQRIGSLRVADLRGPGLIKMVAGVNLPAARVPEESFSPDLFAPGGPLSDEYQFNTVLTLGPKLSTAEDARAEIAQAAETPEFAAIRAELEALAGAEDDRIIETLGRLKSDAPTRLGRQWSGGVLEFLRRNRK